MGKRGPKASGIVELSPPVTGGKGSTLAEKIRFAEKHLTAPDGERFSFTGRDWLRDQVWGPLDRWKLWPENKARCCDDCLRRAGTFVDDAGEEALTKTKDHAATGCDGLRVEPTLIAAAYLKRQSGKTLGTAGWILANAFLGEHESIAMLAGSEDQAIRLYETNYRDPIKNSPALSEWAQTFGTKIVIEDKHSEIEVLPTALSSVGGTRTAVVIDECRIVPPDVFVAMLPMLFARGGWRCPMYHVRTHKGANDPDAPKICTVCGKPTVPWFGRALLLSSAGELKDTEQDWFNEFCEHYSANPHPNVHVFRSQETLNPKVSAKVQSAVAEIFGALESTKVYAGIETGNQAMRKGQVFMDSSDVKRCVDPRLVNLERLEDPCVGFLDTSDSIEKTSLVIVANDPTGEAPWSLVYQARVDFWIPAMLPSGVVDVAEVERHVDSILTTFTGLKAFFIDTRGSRQWTEMQHRIAKTHPIAKRWICNKGEDQDGWAMLYNRMIARPQPRIRLQDIPEQRKEFAGLRWKRGQNDARPTVVDLDRKKMHRDITESLACCCYLADMLSRRSSRIGIAEILRRRAERTGESAVEKVRQSRGGGLTGSAGGHNFGPNSY